ncbi:MAG: hypothetical protein CTY36_08545 [Methylocystis sp.]|nr:MAG: hypothetical protein CTY36_08545 [Methylocystis sp.]
MGHIIIASSSLAASLSEDAGVRSGFALSYEDIIFHLGHENFLQDKLTQPDRIVRIASDEYSDAVGDLLFALGASDQPGMPTLAERLTARLDCDWQSLLNIDELLQIETLSYHHLCERHATGRLDHNGLVADLAQLLGSRQGTIMEPLLDAMSIHLAMCPSFTRSVADANLVQLEKLFSSEDLPVAEGGFFDQRFINYLSDRPEQLEDINWRQFEGLTAEWFSRAGYSVELGPGRDDGGVDVRVWNPEAAPGTPPAIIVQCKREKRKVGKVVVKALWADVNEERAHSGLIVTTSDISPGAAHVCDARSYPITTANRQKVQSWIKAMRRPEVGIVL